MKILSCGVKNIENECALCVIYLNNNENHLILDR